MQALLITSLSTYIKLNRKYYVDDHVFSVTPLGAVSSLYSYFDGGYFDSDGAVHYLHTDYRRSVVMTTDSLHRCTQHVGYYPYGLPHRQADGQPRLCESQELQTALNLNQYRYLARALRPDLALWTPPDPLAAKYPHLNPYTYCASSPTIFTDPTGRDIFVLTTNGTLLSRIKSDVSDSFVVATVLNDNLKIVKFDMESMRRFPYGSIISYTTETTKSGELVGVFNLEHFGLAMELFEFFSDHTSVEWSLYDNSNSDHPKVYLSTSFQEFRDTSCPHYIYEHDLQLSIHYHNHHYSHHPSNLTENNKQIGDISFAKVLSRFSDGSFYIYFNGEYFPYSTDPPECNNEQDGFSGLLNDINCTQQK